MATNLETQLTRAVGLGPDGWMSAAVEPSNDADAPQPMDDSELASILASHESRAVGYYTSEIADEQAQAINYYYGRMDDVPALDGCSSVVDNSVAVMVDNALAAVLKPFVSADEVVAFDPRGPEDVDMAEQATEYVNYVILCDNPGFMILHHWMKDALLTKVGIVKAWWEDQSKSSVQQVPMDAMQLEMARQDPNYLREADNGDGTFTVDMQQIEADGRIRVENVPPEEFLISTFARTIEDTPYAAHKPTNYTRSDLLELGFDADIVDGLPAYSATRQEESRAQARYQDEEWASGNREVALGDKSRDIIGIIDEYVKVDYDGDGIAETRRVIRVDDVILFNEVVEENPFALLCPCPMPHKIYGRSTADQAIQGQKIGTVLTRQTLDNLYKTNNPRPVIGDRALGASTMDDISETAPGAKISVNDINQFRYDTVPFTAGHSYQMLEASAQQTEERTGFQRKGNGLNPETLKKNSPDTATQASIDENSRNERAEMVARIFAETGVKRLFKLILGLLIRHQPKSRVIRLRNRWVEMDPRGWNPEMDVSISVGLGVGNKSEQIGQAQTVLSSMRELGATEYAYLIGPQHVHNAMKRLYTAAGIKDTDNYIGDPATTEKPEPQPDPKTQEAQAKLQIEAQKQQAQQAAAAQQMQFDQQMGAVKLQQQAQAEQAKMQLQQATAQANAMLEQQKAQAAASLAQQRADFEAQLALRDQQFEMALAAERLRMERENSAAVQRMSRERPGGKLNK